MTTMLRPSDFNVHTPEKLQSRARRIKALLAYTDVPKSEIAKREGCSTKTVRRINTGECHGTVQFGRSDVPEWALNRCSTPSDHVPR